VCDASAPMTIACAALPCPSPAHALHRGVPCVSAQAPSDVGGGPGAAGCGCCFGRVWVCLPRALDPE
jgi:hypothetical protein